MEKTDIHLHIKDWTQKLSLVLLTQEMLIVIISIHYTIEFQPSENPRDYNPFLMSLSFKVPGAVNTDK